MDNNAGSSTLEEMDIDEVVYEVTGSSVWAKAWASSDIMLKFVEVAVLLNALFLALEIVNIPLGCSATWKPYDKSLLPPTGTLPADITTNTCADWPHDDGYDTQPCSEVRFACMGLVEHQEQLKSDDVTTWNPTELGFCICMKDTVEKDQDEKFCDMTIGTVIVVVCAILTVLVATIPNEGIIVESASTSYFLIHFIVCLYYQSSCTATEARNKFILAEVLAGSSLAVCVLVHGARRYGFRKARPIVRECFSPFIVAEHKGKMFIRSSPSQCAIFMLAGVTKLPARVFEKRVAKVSSGQATANLGDNVDTVFEKELAMVSSGQATANLGDNVDTGVA